MPRQRVVEVRMGWEDSDTKHSMLDGSGGREGGRERGREGGREGVRE